MVVIGRKAWLIAAACVGLAACTGCVRRRMTIVTSVPDATIYVNDEEVGRSPVSIDFTYYGPRKIQAFKDRHKTVTVVENVKAPWYQITPIDFVADNLLPWEIRDERVVQIELEPQPIVHFEDVWRRAEQLRGQP